MARPNPRYEQLLQEQEELNEIKNIADIRLKEIEKTPADIVSNIATEQRNIISQANLELIEVNKEIIISSEVSKIIQDLDDQKLIAPSYFNNNIVWVLSGHITNEAFLHAYHSYVDQGVIHSPIMEPEVEPMVLLSANVKISFINSNIGGFSSSIPIDDIGQLQILSNESSEWRYTLIGTSTNQPLQTLSELINMINENLLLLGAAAAQAAAAQAAAAQAAAAQAAAAQAAAAQAAAAQAAAAQAAEEQAAAQVEEVIVADVTDPSTQGAFEDTVDVENGERDITPTPTEERPVKWIPEPFFSFINEVFGK